MSEDEPTNPEPEALEEEAQNGAEEPNPPAPPPPQKRKTRLKRLLLVTGLLPVVLVVLIVGLVLFLPSIVTGDRVREEAVSALTKLLGTEVRIGRLEYHPLGGVELFDFVIGPPEGFERDVFRASRVAVLYDLSGALNRSVVVKEISLEDPILVQEKRGEQTNVAVILGNLGAGKKKEEEPEKGPSEPLRGPITPVDVTLAGLDIGPITMEVVGDGPNFTISGGMLHVDAQIDRERFSGKVTVAYGRDRAADDFNNIKLSMPKTKMRKEMELEADFGLEVQFDIAGDASDGIAVEVAKLTIQSETGVKASYGEDELRPAIIKLSFELDVRPGEDKAEISKVGLGINSATMIDADGEIIGLYAALEQVMGKMGAQALSGTLGLVRGEGEGVARVSIRTLAVPFAELASYADVAIPGAKVDGTFSVGPTFIEGTMTELIAGLPRRLSVVIGAEGVSAVYPQADVKLGALDGRLELKRNREGPGSVAPAFSIDGGFALKKIAQAKNRVERADLSLAATAERLVYPIPGALTAEVGLKARGIQAPPAKVNQANVLVTLEGQNIFDKDRSAFDPVQVTARVEGGRIRVVQSATQTTDLRGLVLKAKATLDHLLTAAQKPIGAEIDLAVSRAAAAGIKAERVRLKVDATATDPRTKRMLDAKAKVRLGVKRLVHPAATVKGLALDLKATGDQTGALVVPGLGKMGMVPRVAGVDLDLVLDEVAADLKEKGTFKGKVGLSTRASVNMAGATAHLKHLRFTIDDYLEVKASGRSRRVFSDKRWLDADLKVLPIDLKKAVKKAPKGFLKGMPDLTAAGGIALDVRTTGTLPKSGALDLAALPMEGHVRLSFGQIAAQSKEKKFGVKGLDGFIQVNFSEGRTEVETKLGIGGASSGVGSKKNQMEQLTLRTDIGYREDVWSFNVDARANRFRAAGDRKAAGASINIDLVYPKRGDLNLRRFDVMAPASGIELAMKGRLSRRSFGVLRPDLSIKGFVDLDKLKKVLPDKLKDLKKGRVAANLDVRSKGDQIVDVKGALELDGMDYANPTVAVFNVTGRLPVEQRLSLPRPYLDEKVATAEGVFGDDLEARFDELGLHFAAAKAHFDSMDILVEAPRTADYEAMRPYLAQTGARMTMDGIVYKEHAIQNIWLEGMWKSGVFRIDRFAARVWEGDILGDLAVQLTADQNIRVRMRGTITDLNLDVPYSMARGIEAVSGSEKEKYRIAGTMDVELAIKERVINARIDLAKVSKELVDRMFGAMGFSDESSPAQAMKISERAGVRPVAGKIWISQNLLNVVFVWERLWLHLSSPDSFTDVVLEPFFAAARPILIPTLGAWVINTVNGAIRRFSVSSILEEQLAKNQGLQNFLESMEGRVISSDRASTPSQAALP